MKDETTTSTTDRIKALHKAVTGDGRERPETSYYNVAWHVKQKAWRVKIHFQGSVFYKEFPLALEAQAAWVADCAGIMMKGQQAFELAVLTNTKASSPLNFDWSHGEPPCPGGTYNIYDVYGWLVSKNIPLKLKPSGVVNNEHHPNGCENKKTT